MNQQAPKNFTKTLLKLKSELHFEIQYSNKWIQELNQDEYLKRHVVSDSDAITNIRVLQIPRRTQI